MLILVTGATGKVGQHFIARLLDDPRFSKARIRALCHNRVCRETERVEVVRGSIAERAAVNSAFAGVTHVVHLATCKETPADVMDVTVKGLFRLLETFRTSASTRGLASVDIPSRFHSTWMDNSKARCLLSWNAVHDLKMLIDSAWGYERSEEDPRIVRYPG